MSHMSGMESGDDDRYVKSPLKINRALSELICIVHTEIESANHSLCAPGCIHIKFDDDKTSKTVCTWIICFILL